MGNALTSPWGGPASRGLPLASCWAEQGVRLGASQGRARCPGALEPTLPLLSPVAQTTTPAASVTLPFLEISNKCIYLAIY